MRDNEPYGRLSEIVNGHAFTAHPYKHPTIGTVAGLEAASLDEVRAFYRTYLRACERHGGHRRRCRPRPGRGTGDGLLRPDPRAFARGAAGHSCRARSEITAALVVEEGWPLPVVVVAHHVTFDGHPDSYPLQMASKILSDGQSARLYRKLVYETGIASSAAAVGQLTEHPNLFYAFAVVQPGHTPAEAERALVQELDRLRTEPVSERRTDPREAAVHPRFRAGQGDRSAESQRPRPRGRAAQGRRGVCRRGVRPLPAGQRSRHPAGGADLLRAEHPHGDHGDAEARERRRRMRGAPRRAPALAAAAILAIAAAGPAAAQVRNWPSEPVPKPLATRALSVPPYEVRTLANGLRVVVVEHHEQPAGEPAAPRRRRHRQRPDAEARRREHGGVAARPGNRDAIGAADRGRGRRPSAATSASARAPTPPSRTSPCSGTAWIRAWTCCRTSCARRRSPRGTWSVSASTCGPRCG